MQEKNQKLSENHKKFQEITREINFLRHDLEHRYNVN